MGGGGIVDPVDIRRSCTPGERDLLVAPGWEQSVDGRAQLIGAVGDDIARLGLEGQRSGHLTGLGPVGGDVGNRPGQPGDDGHGQDHRPDGEVEKGGESQGHQQDERNEHDRCVAGAEGTVGHESPDDGQGQGAHDHDGQGTAQGAGADIDIDVATVDGHAEQSEPREREQDQGQQASLIGGTSGKRGDGIDHGREVGRCGPRRTGVLGLVEEDLDPGQECQATDDHGDERHPCVPPPDRPPPPGLVSQPRQGGGNEVDGPVLAVQQQPRHHGDGDQVAGPRFAQSAIEGQVPEHGQQRDQRVHPRLGVVPDGEGRRGHQEHGREPEDTAPQPAPGQPGQRHRDHSDDPRQRAHGQVRRSEDAHPDMEERVEQRRCTVPLEVGGEVMQGQLGDVDGQGLVEPQVGSGPEAKHQTEGENQGHDHADGHGDPAAEVLDVVPGAQQRTTDRVPGSVPLGTFGVGTEVERFGPIRPHVHPANRIGLKVAFAHFGRVHRRRPHSSRIHGWHGSDESAGSCGQEQTGPRPERYRAVTSESATEGSNPGGTN